MIEQYYHFTVETGIATLLINRPDRLNALNADMVKALGDMCARIDHDDAIRVLLLSGEGRAFCAGGDIDAWSDEPPRNFGQRWVRDGHRVFDGLARLRQPVIAVLNGHVLGGGLELAACADYRIAEQHIKIGQPETGLGIIPGWSGTQRAVRRFGSQNIRRMAMFGDLFTAEEALKSGIVDQVVETGQGMAAGMEKAERILSRSMEATELTKVLINAAEGEEQERVLEALAGRIASGSAELSEGLSAFHEKRKPNFNKQ